MIGGALLRKLLKATGRDVVPYDHVRHAVARRMWLLEHHRITTVLDIGANVGGFGLELRELGYRGRIISFEPLRDAYRELASAAAGDSLWMTHNCGIGASDTTTEINVAANVQSSSLLEMLPAHLQSAPESSYRTRETISLRSLDSIAPELQLDGETVYLKSDTQGYESEVLKGAVQTLDKVTGLQLELSLIPLYAGETLLAPMIERMREMGFQLVSLEDAFVDPSTGCVLQVDGIFFRIGSEKGAR